MAVEFNWQFKIQSKTMADIWEDRAIIARWPKHILSGAKSDLPSVQYDLMATLAELTGAKVPVTDGISFLPTLPRKSDKQTLQS